MSSSQSLVIPILLWGDQAPTHCISCLLLSKDQTHLVTGSQDGQIVVWETEVPTYVMKPKTMIWGHTASILCLASASKERNLPFFVSSSENGEMCVWDLTEGRCVESTKLSQIHTHMTAHVSGEKGELRLFCAGYYTEILVMDPLSLEILISLSSRVNPDWISAFYVLRPAKRNDDVILGITVAGHIKVWTLSGKEKPTNDFVYENESKQLRCLNAGHLTCCVHNLRVVLIVTRKFWQIYDASDFSLLATLSSPRGERWLGGDFLATDRVILWSDAGIAYLYVLPTNCNTDSKEFHNRSHHSSSAVPFLYCKLSMSQDTEPLPCPPAFLFNMFPSDKGFEKFLFRGDAYGRIFVWKVPEMTNKEIAQLMQLQTPVPGQEQSFDLPVAEPLKCLSLQSCWDELESKPVGILSRLETEGAPSLTATVYLPQQGRIVCGREDGSILILPGAAIIALQLLEDPNNKSNLLSLSSIQSLAGHSGKVTALLYPHHTHPRYDVSHLVSGGADFAVCLWDLYSGSLLHRFCNQGGEITQLLVPPENCSARIQQTICSVAADHSVCLLGLKERRMVLLASRHLFPVVTIKWRPEEDFLVIETSDGSVYVWEMETGSLDRMLMGRLARECLAACDDAHSSSAATTDRAMANPAVHFFRGLRHKNLAAIKHAAQRGLDKLAASKNQVQESLDFQGTKGSSMMIQGLKANPKDPDAHILFFDIEALIVQLLYDEYASMSPNTLETHGLSQKSEYEKAWMLTESASPDAQRKIADFLGKVMDKAETMEKKLKEERANPVPDLQGLLTKVREGAGSVQQKIQESISVRAEKEELVSAGIHSKKSDDRARLGMPLGEISQTIEIAQLLISLLHAWGLDKDLDRVGKNKLGLRQPKVPVSYGIVSRGGYMSLYLPTWSPHARAANVTPQTMSNNWRWGLSACLTTNHLLAILSVTNTLMSMRSPTFLPELERKKKLLRQTTLREDLPKATIQAAQTELSSQQSQINQGWSLVATLHCVLLPDLVAKTEGDAVSEGQRFRKVQVDILARRWQDRCIEVRQASQALLLAELNRIGSKGRKILVDAWAPFLPSFGSTSQPTSASVTPSTSRQENLQQGGAPPAAPSSDRPDGESAGGDDDDDEEGMDNANTGQGNQPILSQRQPSSQAELKRKQATAIVLLGVIGAEFGQEIEGYGKKSTEEVKKRGGVQEGFGISSSSLARQTSQALMYLLLAEPSSRLPAHTSLRRAAVDLIGRGFSVWEPYLDVAKVVLGLLELCCDADRLVPSMSYGLPLTPHADTCRSARHALSQLAIARPQVLITTLSREVARFNALQQNAQTLNVNLGATVLARSKPEMLRLVEILIEKFPGDIIWLMLEVMDIILHCVDPGHLKTKGLHEVFPAIARFPMVSHCPHTRRIAAGSRIGQIALHELKGTKTQILHAHNQAINACAFSHDGKFLATYCDQECKICLWQTTSGMFGLGTSQTKCVKTFPTPSLPESAKNNPDFAYRSGRLVWINNRTLALMMPDGSETRVNL